MVESPSSQVVKAVGRIGCVWGLGGCVQVHTGYKEKDFGFGFIR